MLDRAAHDAPESTPTHVQPGLLSECMTCGAVRPRAFFRSDSIHTNSNSTRSWNEFIRRNLLRSSTSAPRKVTVPSVSRRAPPDAKTIAYKSGRSTR